MERLTRNSIPGILCGIVILILTGLPGSFFPHVKPAIGLDKVAHVLMYAGFAFACLWGYRKQFVSNGQHYRRKAIILTVIISIAYGGLTEIMQETITFLHRSGDWRDLIADSIGTGIGVLVFYLFFRRKKIKFASFAFYKQNITTFATSNWKVEFKNIQPWKRKNHLRLILRTRK